MSNSEENPYQSPLVPSPPVRKTNKDYAGKTCPYCTVCDARVPKYTWWGGVFGPRILSHVICNGCGKGFSSKTGKSNLSKIILYHVFFLVFFFVVFLAQYFLL